jgi:NADPH:quinone reductase-like Zn-dependent oxidoreductase
MTEKQHLVFRLPHKGASCKAIEAQLEPLPSFDKHEVLVKIKSIALNYRDIAICNGNYPGGAKDSLVPCSDACGEVVEIGSDVRDFQVGDRVLSLFSPNTLYGTAQKNNVSLGGLLDGVLQEYRVFPEYGLVKLPKESKMTDSEAASLVCAGTTVWNAFYGNIPLKPGQTVLLQGTGGVSIIGLQVARAAGAVTIITSSSDEKLKYVKEKYGADYTINYRTHPDWQNEVLEYTGGRGVDYVIENGGIGTIQKSVESLVNGGTIALIGFLSSISPQNRPDVTLLALMKSAVVCGILVGSKQQQEELVRFAVAKDLHIAVDKEFEFTEEGIFNAFEYLKAQSHIGKVCIRLA